MFSLYLIVIMMEKRVAGFWCVTTETDVVLQCDMIDVCAVWQCVVTEVCVVLQCVMIQCVLCCSMS